MTVFYDFTADSVRFAYGTGLYTSANAGFYFGGDNIIFSRPSSKEGCVYTMMSIKWNDIFSAETVKPSAAA